MDFDVKNAMRQAITGRGMQNYSDGDVSDSIRKALIDMNGGSTKINPKTFYKGSELYQLVEELVPVMVEEGFRSDNPLLTNLVEYRNIAYGDLATFTVQPDYLFLVADAAAGIRGVRRQRIENSTTIEVPTVWQVIRVYDDWERFMAGKIDFNDLVNRVARSITQKTLETAYTALTGISENTAGLGPDYVVAASADDESALITLIDHVEASTGATASIYGTRAALRQLTAGLTRTGDPVDADYYNMGYIGRFNGTPTYALKQFHAVGTDNFVLDDNKIYVLAGNDKPVKIVNEGTGWLSQNDPLQANDLTSEYVYGQRIGCGVICAQKFGVLTFAE